MMTCRELAEALHGFVADELAADRRRVAEDHLQVCPPCEALVHSYSVVVRLSRRLPPLPLPASLRARLGEVLGGPAG